MEKRSKKIEKLYYSSNSDYTMLPKSRVEYAIEKVPNQTSTKHSDWSCGPNTGLRALYLIGDDSYQNYVSFVENCPRLTEPYDNLTFGYGTVGPTPNQLAKYLDSKLDITYHITVRNMDKQMIESDLECIKGRLENENIPDFRKQYPTIALIIQSTFEMHYINIISFNEENYVILDTDGQVGYIRKSRLKHWLDRDGYANFMLKDRYTTITFCELSGVFLECQKIKYHHINNLGQQRHEQNSYEFFNKPLPKPHNGMKCSNPKVSWGGCIIL